jgi:hypothetical protein
MKNLLTSDKVYLGKSKIRSAGRGVFAGRDIKKGEIIEKCPVIEVSKDNTSYLSESILASYIFFYGKKKERSLVALGYGSIYNHTEKANAKFKIREKDMTIDFVAIKDIKKDEEITFDYRNGTPKKSPLWFEMK